MALTETQIKHMVDRFLSWKLPYDFKPDGGISFKPYGGISFKREFNEHTPFPMVHKPSGTNLLDASQAEAMVRHMIEGIEECRTAPLYSRWVRRRAAPSLRPTFTRRKTMDMDEIVEIVAGALAQRLFGTDLERPDRPHSKQSAEETCKRIAEVSLSALSARGLAVVKGWQPIETAPKGNGAFLVWLEDEGFATLGRWRKWSADGKSGEDVYLSSMDAYADEHTPTHWMPLPAAPGGTDGNT